MREKFLKKCYLIVLGCFLIGCILQGSSKNVYAAPALKSVSFSVKKVTLSVGEQKKLKIKKKPQNAKTGKITWKSSNTKVASVTKKGVVKAKKKGNAKITATVTSGNKKKKAVCNLQVKQPVKSLKINVTTLEIKQGDSFKVQTTVSPVNANNKRLSYSSSNANVATVTKEGVIYGAGLGTAEITIKTTDASNIKKVISVTVKENKIPVTDLQLTVEKTELMVDEQVQLTAAIQPADATNPQLQYVSSNEAVATVTATGVITAYKSGTTDITVRTMDGSNLQKVVTITVKDKKIPVTDLKLKVRKTNLEVNDQIQISTELQPVNASNQQVQYLSSNEQVATVTAEGMVKACKVGTADITVSTMDGSNISKTLTINVLEDMSDGDVYYQTPSDYRNVKTGVSYGTVETVTYASKTTGTDRKVTVALPYGYTESKEYPVLYLLHGLGQDNTQWTAEGRAEYIIGNLVADNEAEEMIIVMPNCRARENDAANPPDEFSLDNYRAFDNFKNDLQNDLMPFLENKYSIAKGRENTAIAGFSMGGRTALYIGLSMQDTFGYVGGFCPAPGIFKYTLNGVTEDGLFTKDTFCLQEEYALNTLVMIVAGKSDTIVWDFPESYHQALKENDSQHIWYKVSGGHDFNVTDNGLYHFAKRIFK